MNSRKNAEAIFLAAAIIGTFISFATAAEPRGVVAAPVAANGVAGDSAMQVVVIKGHRLSAAQKVALN